MRSKLPKLFLVILSVFCLSLLSGCGLLFSNDSIVNRYADVLLTKNNELQFRFRINHELLEGHDLYKVKVSIHDKKLISAIGKKEIVYGEDQVLNGEYLNVNGNEERFIFMDPIPLKKDLHIQELQTLIEKDKAVSVEVFNDKHVLGSSFLTNFSSEL
jgi:hypothetical protein